MAVEKDIVADHVQDKAKLELHKQHSVCLVLDFGSQYTQLIGRRVRSLNVYSMLKPGDISLVRLVSHLQMPGLWPRSSSIEPCTDMNPYEMTAPLPLHTPPPCNPKQLVAERTLRSTLSAANVMHSFQVRKARCRAWAGQHSRPEHMQSVQMRET